MSMTIISKNVTDFVKQVVNPKKILYSDLITFASRKGFRKFGDQKTTGIKTIICVQIA